MSSKASGEFVEEKSKYINTQDLFDELFIHPRKRLTLQQEVLQSKDFHIPEEVKPLKGFELHARERDLNNQHFKNSSHDPTEHTLMKLLFGNLIEEVDSRVPRLTREIMDPDFHPDMKKLEELPVLSLDLQYKSNILKMHKRDSLLQKSDFMRIFPTINERQYHDVNVEMDFDLVHGRHGDGLFLTGDIYLIFPDFVTAAWYYTETLDKTLNGNYLNCSFASVDEEFSSIQLTSVPLLGKPQYLTKSNETDTSSLLAFRQHRGSSEPRKDDDTKLISRDRYCIFRNLPSFVSTDDLLDTLWSYSLSDIDGSSITKLTDRNMLVAFESKEERDRCIAKYDNRHWFRTPKMPLVVVEAL